MIFIDMDGVLCDWDTPMLTMLNHLINSPSLATARMHKKLLDDIRSFLEGQPITKELLKLHLPLRNSPLNMVISQLLRDPKSDVWWATLSKTKHCDTLLDVVRSTNLPWAILTKPISRNPSKNIGCVLGKFEWVRQNVGEMFFIVDGDKGKYGSPRSILIDDTQSNIDAFTFNGGEGILWGPWD